MPAVGTASAYQCTSQHLAPQKGGIHPSSPILPIAFGEHSVTSKPGLLNPGLSQCSIANCCSIKYTHRAFKTLLDDLKEAESLAGILLAQFCTAPETCNTANGTLFIG